jgi:N-acetylglucosaminyl-diphospho-decaprenol L-rhamnosyltransferase
MVSGRNSGERPRVDVGVLTWNTAELSAQAMRRMLDSDQGADIRLLVRDNASHDDTVETLRRVVPEAEIDTGAENLGFAAGVNTLLRRSTAPWFFLLNSDAWPLEGAIGRLVRAAEGHPEAAAVVPRLEYPDGRLQHSTHPFPSLRTAATVNFRWDRISRERAEELFLEGSWMHDRPRRVDWAHGAAMLIPRNAVDRVGGFDERFFFYAEDLEWCWRAHTLGLGIWFEPGAVVRHVSSASGDQLLGTGTTKAHLGNSLRFYRRAHGTPSAIGWWAMNTSGGLLRIAKALRRRDRAAASRWAGFVVAQLAAPFVSR